VTFIGQNTQDKARANASRRVCALKQWKAARAEGKTELGERQLSDEGRAAISEANKGQPKSPEQRAKISKSKYRFHREKFVGERDQKVASVFSAPLPSTGEH
jgi:hypothetical protein